MYVSDPGSITAVPWIVYEPLVTVLSAIPVLNARAFNGVVLLIVTGAL